VNTTMLKKKYYVHTQGICETRFVGPRTKIWAFTHVLPKAQIGSDVNLCDHVFVENDVTIGNRVTVKCFVALWDGLRIEDDVFIGPGVVFANDKYTRSKMYLPSFPKTVIRKGASIGAGAVILPGIEVGAYAMVAAGAVVTKNVAPFELVRGIPARRKGSVCKCGFPLKKHKMQWRCVRSGWHGARPSPEMDCVR